MIRIVASLPERAREDSGLHISYTFSMDITDPLASLIPVLVAIILGPENIPSHDPEAISVSPVSDSSRMAVLHVSDSMSF